jgi:hypothetical protein
MAFFAFTEDYSPYHLRTLSARSVFHRLGSCSDSPSGSPARFKISCIRTPSYRVSIAPFDIVTVARGICARSAAVSVNGFAIEPVTEIEDAACCEDAGNAASIRLKKIAPRIASGRPITLNSRRISFA